MEEFINLLRPHFLSTGTWLRFGFFILLVLSAVMYIFWIRKTSIPLAVWVSLTFIALFAAFVLTMVIQSIIINSRQQLSTVNISPLVQLNEIQVEHVEEAILKLCDNEFIVMIDVVDFSSDRSQLTRAYSFFKREEENHNNTYMKIDVHIFLDEALAEERLQLTKKQLSSHDYIFIANDNNTEVLLRHPYMSTSSTRWYIPTDERQVYSYIRLGKILIQFHEVREWYDLDNNLTSKIIASLVQTIQDE